MNVTPPKWATRSLSWYCKSELLEDLQGDLNEYFDRNVKSKGVRKAKLIYAIDVFKFLRLYTIRKPEFINLLIQWIMIGSYVKTSTRSIVRNKLFSAINIIGLSVSMSVGLLVIAFITDLTSYDDFHKKKDRIYRVITSDARANQPPMKLATTSVKAGKEIAESITGIENLTILRNGFGGDATINQTTLPISGLWADESFFKVFSFELLQGDPSTALKEPYSLVLTEKSASKIFGNEEALGKSLILNKDNYVITGILKDVPKLSHMRFESLASFSTVELQKPDTDGDFFSWENIFMSYVYLTLPEGGDRKDLQANLTSLSERENSVLKGRKIRLSLQPLSKISIGSHLTNEIGPSMNSIALWILAGLACIIILSACFNYTNLSIARTLRRSREVGIRKVIGARNSNIMSQFIIESIIISLLALGCSFLLFLSLKVQFISLHSFVDNLTSLELSTKLILYFIALAILVGLLAGFMPALFFSRINTIQVLKSVSTIKFFKHITMRKTLIFVQYVFSLTFITVTILGYSQYKNFLTFDLGFTTENILNIRLQGNKADLVIKELSEIPAVTETSQSAIITSLGNIYGSQLKYKNDSAGMWLNYVDVNYLPLHQHKLLAGRNFNPMAETGDESEIIVNEQVLKRFNIGDKDPLKALGESVIMDGKNLTIVGVMKDFHYETLEDEIQPTVFRNSVNGYQYINAKISTHDLPAVMEKIENSWKKIDKTHSLDAKFYDDQIEHAYSAFSMMIKVIGFLAFLAVCIASLGLFGMVVFTTETRVKEISILKVLGASVGGLIYQLGKGFMILLLLAALIAIPATYFFFDKIVLTNFAYHQPIKWFELISGTLAIVIMAFIMIMLQTLRAARINPAEVLKNE
jgi:putative ABC transport system permease protein